jgi:hypothetical protein
LRCLGALPNCPCADFIGTTSKVPDQIQASISSLSDLSECARCTGFLFGLCSLFIIQASKALLERNRERNEWITRVVGIDPSLDLGEPFVLLANVVFFGEVYEIGDGFRCQEGERVDDFDLETRFERLSKCAL